VSSTRREPTPDDAADVKAASFGDFAGRLGIFARTFRRSTPHEVAREVAAAGFAVAHWNFAAIGLPTLAADVAEDEFAEVRAAFDVHGLVIPSVSATFNTVHPDATARAITTRQAVRLIGLAPLLGADVVTLCTGTRDPEDMWRAHPANEDPTAWADLRSTLDRLLQAAGDAGVRLGIEPEPGNVVKDAPTAARLLDQLGADAPIGIVLDPANLLTPETVHRQNEVLAAAVDLLGPRVIAAQAKDVVASGYSAAGAGLLDYPAVLAQLDRCPPVPLVAQDVEEDDAARVRSDLIRWHAEAMWR
jgi:sugar phosphate isomerase/epimerase